jgi:hypothetical protein
MGGAEWSRLWELRESPLELIAGGRFCLFLCCTNCMIELSGLYLLGVNYVLIYTLCVIHQRQAFPAPQQPQAPFLSIRS